VWWAGCIHDVAALVSAKGCVLRALLVVYVLFTKLWSLWVVGLRTSVKYLNSGRANRLAASSGLAQSRRVSPSPSAVEDRSEILGLDTTASWRYGDTQKHHKLYYMLYSCSRRQRDKKYYVQRSMRCEKWQHQRRELRLKAAQKWWRKDWN